MPHRLTQEKSRIKDLFAHMRHRFQVYPYAPMSKHTPVHMAIHTASSFHVQPLHGVGNPCLFEPLMAVWLWPFSSRLAPCRCLGHVRLSGGAVMGWLARTDGLPQADSWGLTLRHVVADCLLTDRRLAACLFTAC